MEKLPKYKSFNWTWQDLSKVINGIIDAVVDLTENNAAMSKKIDVLEQKLEEGVKQHAIKINSKKMFETDSAKRAINNRFK